MVEAPSCYHNFMQLLKLICDIRNLKDVVYISLCWDMHVKRHWEIISDKNITKEIRGTTACGNQLNEMALQRGSRGMHQVGQGHRAVMIAPQLRDYLMDQKVSNWFDL